MNTKKKKKTHENKTYTRFETHSWRHREIRSHVKEEEKEEESKEIIPLISLKFSYKNTNSE